MGFGVFDPINAEQPHRDHQKAPPCAETRHTTYRSLRSVEPFLHSSSFYPTPKIVCCTMLLKRPTPQVPISVGASITQHLTRGSLYQPDSVFPTASWLAQPFFSRFCTAHGSVPIFQNYPPLPTENCSMVGSWPALIHGSLAHPVYTPNGKHLDQFSCFLHGSRS